MMATEISEEGLALIAEFEGFRATPYEDPVGHCTVGYGFLLHFGSCTPEELALPPITEAEGLRQLRLKARPYVKEVVEGCRPLNQNELDALTSLCYNIGRSGFARSSVRKAVNEGGDVTAALRQYVKGTNGVIYPGLVRRREAEITLFFKEEDEMWNRINGKADWWSGRVLSAGPEGTMRLDKDFPTLPPCRAVDLDVYLAPGSQGSLIIKDGSGAFAGKVTPWAPHQVIRAVPGWTRQLRFEVEGPSATVETMGVVGYLA